MYYFKYILLAFIQGITEPLPISSSGHMILFKQIFNTNLFNNLNFEVICNFGSFLAIFTIFKSDISKLIKFNYLYFFKKEKFYKKYFKYLICLFISTIPVCISGLIFKNKIESLIIKPYFLGICFMITAFFLFIVRNKSGKKDDFNITYKDAIIIGIFQMITIIPGISRCGTTLVACLICNLKKDTALKYTFMLYFPVSIASLILCSYTITKSILYESFLIPYLVCLGFSSIITYYSYNYLNNIVKKGKLIYFCIYCLILSLFIFIYFR